MIQYKEIMQNYLTIKNYVIDPMQFCTLSNMSMHSPIVNNKGKCLSTNLLLWLEAVLKLKYVVNPTLYKLHIVITGD